MTTRTEKIEQLLPGLREETDTSIQILVILRELGHEVIDLRYEVDCLQNDVDRLREDL